MISFSRITCSAVAILCTISAFANNLAPNPSFEKPGRNGLPAQWNGYAPHNAANFGTDSSIAHEGTHSATIETTSDQIGVLVSDDIPVAQGEHLDMSVWMRTQDLTTSSGGLISLSAGFKDRYGSYLSWKRNRVPVPDNSGKWFRLETEAVVPERAAYVTFQAGVRFMTGKLWVDQAEMTTSNSVVLRFDTPSNVFEPGATSIPAVLINRTEHPAGSKARIRTEPGGASLDVTSTAPQTHLTLPFNFSKRGKVAPRAIVTRGSADGTDAVTTIAGNVPPLLETEPLVPTHWLLEETSPRFECRFWINEPEQSRAQMKASCTLTDAAGSTVAEWHQDAGLPKEVNFQLSLPSTPDAPTAFTAHLQITKDSQPIAQADLPWRFIHRADTAVQLAQDGYLRVKDKPFFPIGLYMAGQYAEMRDAGFNVVQTYNPFSTNQGEKPNNNGILEFLDKANAAGMKALVFVNHGLATRLGREESLRRIHMFRNHPAMLVWYEEEAVARGLKPLSWLAELVADMRREGPGHPVLLGDLRDYGVNIKDRSKMLPDELMDIGTWWWYPTPPRNAPVVEDYEGDNAGPSLEYAPPAYLVQAKTKKPLWIALQCYKKPDTADARFPTPDEYRCQAYLAIVAGAKGLYYYTGYGEQGNGILVKPEEGHWAELKALVHELRNMETVFMSTSSTQQPTCSEKMISLLMKEGTDGKRVLIAVNRCNRELPAEFNVQGLAGGKSVSVRFENRSVAAQEGKLKDTFKPYGVHVYELP